MKHDQLHQPYAPEDLEELRRLKPTRFAQARGVQPNEVAMRLLLTLDEDTPALELERLRRIEAAARYQHETGSLHQPETHGPPYRYCCGVGMALDPAGLAPAVDLLPAGYLPTVELMDGQEAVLVQDLPLPRARSLVCSIGRHAECDGGAPNGPAGEGSPCACSCHTSEPCPYCSLPSQAKGAGCMECRGRGTVGPAFRANRGIPPGGFVDRRVEPDPDVPQWEERRGRPTSAERRTV